jgi:hypothetical protein
LELEPSRFRGVFRITNLTGRDFSVAYRGEFAWRPDEARWMRVVGLSGLVLAVWALGFFFGRISAWLVPVTSSQLVTIERIHLRPLAIASDAPPSKMAEAPAGKPMLRAGSITLASTTDKADPPARTDPIFRPGAEPRGSVAIDDPQRARAVAGQRRAGQQDGRRAFAGGSDDAMSACERRFVSFRRSDGTYQPFNRATRERCPFLR